MMRGDLTTVAGKDLQGPHRFRRSVVYSSQLAVGLLLLAILGGAVETRGAEVPVPVFDEASWKGLTWRNIGPFRGGRVTAVTGVVGQPVTFYFGATGGGIWKTQDAGQTWKNISDGHLETGSVGALAVAPSDPNVIYAGMGEAQIRGVTTTHGDGVYRSTDGGSTWTHLGLENTRQISRIRVHPEDPDWVYVAAQGNPWVASEERGIYRSTDGGRTWVQVLGVNDEGEMSSGGPSNVGASDLALDGSNPRILYAAFWHHQRLPWKVISGGAGSGLYKSADYGDTWEKLDSGLPETLGKVGVAVSPTQPQRVWALVEAPGDDGGLYRSDDGGKRFVQVNRERLLRARSWYYTKVFADPRDADTVYVLNAPMLRSIDGGRTFERVSTPHGDNHDLWVAPDAPHRMINGNDGGANVSWTEGASWSEQTNQPTGQFYRVITDNRFPYHVYAGQQDNSTVAVASWGERGIDAADWYPVGGCESAHVAFDPEDPVRVYAGCYQGLISELEVATGQQRNIMAYPIQGLGSTPREETYRFNWNAPIVISPHDPSVLYHAGNVVLRSVDRGANWRVISQDLSRDEDDKQGPGGGPITNEAAGAETYGTIFSLTASPHRPGELWAGSDDGLVHVTRSEGETWDEVTPPDLAEAQINGIEVSPHQPDRIYLAVNRYKLGDDRPYVYVTEDGGESWELRIEGLPETAFVRAVREDLERPGLLYAGTESGLFVSLDNGQEWHTFQLNMPRVPITDLTLRLGDLVAATQGRGLWILDDLSPLHQWTERDDEESDGPDGQDAVASAEDGDPDSLDEAEAEAPFHLFRPRAAYRLPPLGSEAPHTGTNPPQGAVLYFHLEQSLVDTLEATSKEDDPSELVLEILDEDGEKLRRFSSFEAPQDPIDPPPKAEAFGYGKPVTLPAKIGLNRFVWDLRGEEVRRVDDLFVFGAKTYRVVPGTYTARLSWGGASQDVTLDVLADPRQEQSAEAFVEQRDRVRNIWRRVDEIHRSVTRLRSVRSQVEKLLERTADHERAAELQPLGQDLIERIEAWEEPLVQAKQETFQDVINFPNRLNSQYLFLLQVIDASDPPISFGAHQRWVDLENTWLQHRVEMEKIYALHLAAFNQKVDELQIPAVLVPELR